MLELSAVSALPIQTLLAPVVFVGDLLKRRCEASWHTPGDPCGNDGDLVLISTANEQGDPIVIKACEHCAPTEHSGEA